MAMRQRRGLRWSLRIDAAEEVARELRGASMKLKPSGKRKR